MKAARARALCRSAQKTYAEALGFGSSEQWGETTLSHAAGSALLATCFNANLEWQLHIPDPLFLRAPAPQDALGRPTVDLAVKIRRARGGFCGLRSIVVLMSFPEVGLELLVPLRIAQDLAELRTV